MSCTFRSAQTRIRWGLVKSLPWLLYKVAVNPQTGHCGLGLRQMACRSARTVCNAVGAPEEDRVPAINPESVVQDDGRPGPRQMPGLVEHHHVELGVVGLHTSFACADSRRSTNSE